MFRVSSGVLAGFFVSSVFEVVASLSIPLFFLVLVSFLVDFSFFVLFFKRFTMQYYHCNQFISFYYNYVLRSKTSKIS